MTVWNYQVLVLPTFPQDHSPAQYRDIPYSGQLVAVLHHFLPVQDECLYYLMEEM